MLNDKVKYSDPVNLRQVIISCLVLAGGILFYLFARNPDSVLFIYSLGIKPFAIGKEVSGLGFIGKSLPSLLHVYAFSILTSALMLRQNHERYAAICLCWTAVNILAEFGQLLSANNPIFTHVIHDTSSINFMVVNYFASGTFDGMDIVFCILGGISAYTTLLITSKGEPR